jgi:hypothetical protein
MGCVWKPGIWSPPSGRHALRLCEAMWELATPVEDSGRATPVAPSH